MVQQMQRTRGLSRANLHQQRPMPMTPDTPNTAAGPLDIHPATSRNRRTVTSLVREPMTLTTRVRHLLSDSAPWFRSSRRLTGHVMPVLCQAVHLPRATAALVSCPGGAVDVIVPFT